MQDQLYEKSGRLPINIYIFKNKCLFNSPNHKIIIRIVLLTH